MTDILFEIRAHGCLVLLMGKLCTNMVESSACAIPLFISKPYFPLY